MILMGPFQLSMFHDSMLKDVNLCCAAPQRYFKIETGKVNPLPWQTESSGCVCQCVKPYTLKVRQTTDSYHSAFWSILLQAPSQRKLFPSRSQPPVAADGAHNRYEPFHRFSRLWPVGARTGSAGRGATGPRGGTRYSQHNVAFGFIYLFFFHRARVQNSNSSTLRWPLPWRHSQGRKGLVGAAARPVMLNLEKHTFLLDLLIGHPLCERPQLPPVTTHTHDVKARAGSLKLMHLILLLITRLINNVIVYENIYSPIRLILIRTLVKLPVLFRSW